RATLARGAGAPASSARPRRAPNGESRARIEVALGELEPLPRHDPADEARNYRLANGRGVIGFISPVTAPYCGACNRMRLTADGRFHLCLLNDDELDVGGTLRG